MKGVLLELLPLEDRPQHTVGLQEVLVCVLICRAMTFISFLPISELSPWDISQKARQPEPGPKGQRKTRVSYCHPQKRKGQPHNTRQLCTS